MRIKEAVALFNATNQQANIKKGNPIKKGGLTLTGLAQKIWPSSSKTTQSVSMSNLTNGTTKSFKEEWVNIICNETNTDPNFLFGFNKNK